MGGGARSTLQQRARATSFVPAGEARKRPSSAAAAAPSPRRNGEKGPACVFSEIQLAILRQRQPSFSPSPRGEGTSMRVLQNAALHACDDASRPFAPRSGEKVVRQHRMRGCGRWGSIVVAAVRTRNFIGPAGKAEKRPSSAAAAPPSPRRHGEKGQACDYSEVQLSFLRQRQPSFSPSPRGEGTSMRFHQRATLHACDDASLPSPRASGEKGQACAISCCIPMRSWSLLRYPCGCGPRLSRASLAPRRARTIRRFGSTELAPLLGYAMEGSRDVSRVRRAVSAAARR